LLHTDQAISLGLFVNELTTNACKYAFPGHYAPEMHVHCKASDNNIVFDFRDNGAGRADPLSEQKGFGLDLIQILTDRLKGKIRYASRDGFAVSLSFRAEMKPVSAGFKNKLKVS